jgi:cold shock CspA family protein
MSSIDDTVKVPLAGDISSERLAGRVKWFNNRAGFGFVTVMEGDKKDEDVFVHHSGIVVNSEQYKYLVQGEYISFVLRDSDNDDHPYQAGDVRGILSGWLMCETRNANRNSRSDEDGEGDDVEHRSGRGQRRRPENRRVNPSSGGPRGGGTRGGGRSSGPRGGGPRGGNDEWVLTRRNGGNRSSQQDA